MTSDIVYMTAAELVGRYRTGELSPVEATRAVLDRIDAVEAKVNAWVLVDADSALRAARESETRWRNGEPLGPVDGVPTSIKDLVLARGWPTRFGSLTTDPQQPWQDDAPCVARLRESGAVILGKTTTPEFGWKGVTDSPLSGITRNPWNLDRTPGGSSGGAAAALAAGMCHLAIGTDGGGSIRIPAAFSGIFGIKPTFGRVPAWPAGRFGTLGHHGPMARTVEDAALMLSVIARPDNRDWTALPPDPRDYRDGLDDGIAGLRVAYSADFGYAEVDPEVAEIARDAAMRWRDLGADVVETDPGFDDPSPHFRTLWWAGAANGLRSLDGDRKALLEPELSEIVEAGTRIGLFEYLEADAARARLGEYMARFHEDFDLLLSPALAVPAFKAGIVTPRQDDSAKWVTWTPFTFPFNMTKQPAASVPCGLTREGLPVGLQIVGPMFADSLVLRAARAHERITSLLPRVPEL